MRAGAERCPPVFVCAHGSFTGIELDHGRLSFVGGIAKLCLVSPP